MERTIAYADEMDREDVEQLLLEYDMGISGDIGEYSTLKTAGVICAVGKLLLVRDDCFHLEVLGVPNGLQKTGLGSFLLSELISHPSRYCRTAAGCSEHYLITTVARGGAAGFYGKHNFKSCSLSMLAAPYDTQCDDCPYIETCNPVPMLFAK
jgi:N-acetylglutamate synthase-like GNAT family acetyltransferase